MDFPRAPWELGVAAGKGLSREYCFLFGNETGLVQSTGRTGLICDAALEERTPFEADFLELKEREMGEICRCLVLPYVGTDLLSETVRVTSVSSD